MAKNDSTTKKNQKPTFEKLIDLEDNKINVMLLGVSGCGKSTLINSLLGDDLAKTGVGEAVTDTISVYESEELSIRMIDTVGYEFGAHRQNIIKRELAKFSKEGVKTADVTKLIHMIWFCIDGTTKRIDQEVLKYIKSISNSWKNVPIIIVFTKSYSEVEIQENIQMARKAIDSYNLKHKKTKLNIKRIIPVVAKPYEINDSFTVPTSGLDTLISATDALAPEAKRIAKDTVKEIDLKLKRNTANIIMGTAVTAATVVGAVDFGGIADATILVPTQSLMLNQIAKTYNLNNNKQSQDVIAKLIELGTTTIVGKALIHALKAIPGISIAGSALNAGVAGIVTFALGESSINLFERIYSGEELSDIEQLATDIFNKYLPDLLTHLTEFIEKHKDKLTIADLKKFLSSLIEIVVTTNK